MRDISTFVLAIHIKDAKILPDRGGFAHRVCRSGEGDNDFAGLLTTLLLLGERPQIRAFGCEEENAMFAPAYRFPDDPPDPIIPYRAASTTDLPEGAPLAARLLRERDDATRQIAYIRQTLARLGATAQKALT